MLVIGVLLSWIARQPQPRPLRSGSWLGAWSGLALAMVLGFATYAAQGQFAAHSLEIYPAGDGADRIGPDRADGPLDASPRTNDEARTRGTSRALGRRPRHRGHFGIGSGSRGSRDRGVPVRFGHRTAGGQLARLLAAEIAGFVPAATTNWFVARGARFLNYRTLSRASEVLLLMIANALLGNGVDRMIAIRPKPGCDGGQKGLRRMLTVKARSCCLLHDREGQVC
jgi:hypothetical protein